MRNATTLLKLVCVTAPLLLALGCAGRGGTSGAAAEPSKEDQALAAAQNALQEAKAARASADAALLEARANRQKMDEILSAVQGASPDVAQQALNQARAANQAAQEAKEIAITAQEATHRSSARADRMFEKSMRK